MDTGSADAASGSTSPGHLQWRFTQENIFVHRLHEMQLRSVFHYKRRSVDEVEVSIEIFRGTAFLAKASSGLISKSADYWEIAFEQANERLTTISTCNRPLPSSSTYAMPKSTSEEGRPEASDH